MTDSLEDALLATASGLVLLGALVLTDPMVVLLDPTAAAAGIIGALVVEAAFLAPTPAGRLWERPLVRALSTVALLGGAGTLAWQTGPRVLAAACWGLATYFVLLALVIAGVWSNDR